MIIKNYAWISPNNQHLQIQIQKHLDAIKDDTFDIIQFDCHDSSFSDIYEALITPSLFFDAKIMVIYHLDHLLNEDQQIKKFIQVLQRSSQDIILCFQLEMIPENIELKKAFDLYVDIQKSVQMNDQNMSSYIQTILLEDGFSMDFSTQQLFLDRLKNREDTMYTYLTLLKTYKIQHKVITKEDILLMVPAPIEDNIFNIVSSYIDGDIKKSLELFEDLLTNQEDPLSIISMISRKLIEIEDVKRYLKVGLDQRQISEKMHVSNGKAYYLIKEAKLLQTKNIEKIIDDLNILDYKIKSGQIDKTLGVYLFLIGGQHATSDNRHH